MYSHDPYEVIDLWLDQELKAGVNHHLNRASRHHLNGTT